MRTLLRNLRFLPEDQRFERARAAYHFDLMNAARLMLLGADNSFPEGARRTLLQLLLHGQENRKYIALAGFLRSKAGKNAHIRSVSG